MMLIFSERVLQEMREKKRQLNCCDPIRAFENEFREVKKTWWHFSKKNQKSPFW